MTNTEPKIEWLKRKRYAWSKYQKPMSKINFHHINIIEEYNYNIKNVNIVDQSTGSYRFDHWMRKIKIWRSIFWGAFK